MNYITNKYFLITTLLAGTLFSCEKNDPLSELGKVTSEKAPFVTISGMQALYPAGDTIEYNVFYWTIDDNLESLALLKGEQVSAIGSITVDDGAGEVTVSIDTLIETEMAQEGAVIPHDDFDYETARNAYNKPLEYEIPEIYQMINVEEVSLEAFGKFDQIIYSSEIKNAILNALESNGVVTTWESLPGITKAVGIAVQSTLNLQIRVQNKTGVYNDSPVRSVKVGAIEE